METVDFSGNQTITFDDFKEKFYATISAYYEIPVDSQKEFEESILKHVFYDKLNTNEIKNMCNHASFRFNRDEDKNALIETLKLLCNYKGTLKTISPEIGYTKDSCNVTGLKSDEVELPEFLQNIVEMFDMINISQIMKNHTYLCEVAVEKMDAYENLSLDKDSDAYKELVKSIQGKSNAKATHIRSVRNLENGYPNGLYVKEVRAILQKQKDYYPEITDEFIEVCTSIVSARIPYFIGPLNENAKNAWVRKTGNIEYSYAYAMKHGTPVDEHGSIEEWKNRMRSHCTYLSDEYALPIGSFLGETFSILNELNNLTAKVQDDAYALTYQDKVNVINTLFMEGKDVKYSDVANLLHLTSFGTKQDTSQNRKFNNKYTLYPIIARILPELKLDTIEDIFSEQEKIHEIEDTILSINLYNEEKSKIDYFTKKKKYTENVAKALAKLSSNSFYSFSEKFIMHQTMDVNGNTLMSLLFEDNVVGKANNQMRWISEAVDENGNPIDFSANKYEKILQENGGKLDINVLMHNGTPVIPVSRPVIRGLNEALKMYVEMVKVYGIPDRVVVETARDLKDHTVVHEQPARHYDKTEKLYGYLLDQLNVNKNYKALSGIEKWDDIKGYVAKNGQKIELYIRQNGLDLLTGERININHLEDYEIDHILPRGFGDDSMDDKMLISKLANAKKGDRLPLQFIESGETIGNKVITSSSFMKRVAMLYEMKLISEQKKNRLLLSSTDDLDTFINQNLVDTRYIIREFMSILKAYNKYNHYDQTHIVSLRAAYTKLYRRAFNFDKVRDFGDQHHAHDAAILIVADKTLSTYYPHYDQREHKKEDTRFKTYLNFIQDMHSNDEKTKNDLNDFIHYMFWKAYKVSWNSPNSIITEIKETVPYYSTKVEKNYKGKYFEATILNHDAYKENAVLSIVGVNNDKHVFSGVECAAVDFYKVTIKKNNKVTKKHIAVHIPKVIIDANGNIDKEKYLALIKYHYKATELLDENGNLITGYFRFRAFKNDIIYNTTTNCPTKFNIGSIVNNKLELKFINVFSYNSIYKTGANIRNALIKEYNLKTKMNKDGVDFKEIDKHVFVDYVNRNYWNLEEKDKRIATALKMIENDLNIYELSNHLSYIGLIIGRPGTPPTITGQYSPAIDNKQIKKDPDSQYVKLKYNILGLRFVENPYSKLIVTSPREIPGAFSQIKKEEFSWKIQQDNL